MTRSTHNSWLHRFAIASAAATLVLLGFGGLVTSHGAGLAVPDWPNSYGYNMFTFPVSNWVGGIFYEHTHRLVASGVGFLTIILALWLWLKEERRWLRWLGVFALVLVIAQGVLGGLRVTLLRDELGIFHATLAQVFFVLVCALGLFTSRWWVQADAETETSKSLARLGPAAFLVTVLIFAQLVLGASMRHQHAGLAIPDFPLAYGKLWPAMDADAITRYNQHRLESHAANPITAGGVALQMAHRLAALAILVGVAVVAWRGRESRSGERQIGTLSKLWLGLVMAQVALGAATIWSNKSADIATTHVAVGALSLATGALLCLVMRRCRCARPRVCRTEFNAAVGEDAISLVPSQSVALLSRSVPNA
ncbi:MAG: COX15/CtaA family protein [Verrucomicrobia bacterium]|nr:COX15/CtaA family protein [Verrucomicrobiota bacterium]